MKELFLLFGQILIFLLEKKYKKLRFLFQQKRNFLRKWSGEWGTSSIVGPEHWIMTEDMSKSFTTKKGTIGWNLL